MGTAPCLSVLSSMQGSHPDGSTWTSAALCGELKSSCCPVHAALHGFLLRLQSDAGSKPVGTELFLEAVWKPEGLVARPSGQNKNVASSFCAGRIQLDDRQSSDSVIFFRASFCS